MELDLGGAELLFQVLTEREEKASVAIASNEAFSPWTRTFTDPRLCAADRRSALLRRQHHRDRHRLLPARPNPRPHRASDPRTGLILTAAPTAAEVPWTRANTTCRRCPRVGIRTAAFRPERGGVITLGDAM